MSENTAVRTTNPFRLDGALRTPLPGVCDLRSTDPKTLQKYMGREAAARFLELHRAVQPDWRKVS